MMNRKTNETTNTETTEVTNAVVNAEKAPALSPLKGTRDYLPESQRIRARIIRTLEDTFALYGYLPVETPILNRFDLLASKYAGGAEILREVYRLRDQGGRALALRYDLTVPFARMVGMNPDRPMPFRRYEIGRVFRDGPVKAGRNREFTQCDVDVAGIVSVQAEAELMEMAVRVYDLLGMDVEIRFNNRKWLQGIIEMAGVPAAVTPAVITSLDKLEKIGRSAIQAELSAADISDEAQKRLFDALSLPREALLSQMNAVLPASDKHRQSAICGLLAESSDELADLEAALEALGVSGRMVFSPMLARGLDIYTGTVWEVYMKSGPITSSVGAGGRYDGIIGQFLRNGRSYPAVGMTFGLDVIFAVLESQERLQTAWQGEVTVIPIGTELYCLCLVKAIREQGVPVVMEMGGRKLKQAMRDAARREAPYVVLIGETELSEGMVRIRDMREGMETSVALSEVPQWLKRTRTALS